MPASKNSSKSWLNFPEAIASWLLLPREDCTTSPAEWLSSAAVWFRSVWASWKDLEHGGSWKKLGLITVGPHSWNMIRWNFCVQLAFINCDNLCNNVFFLIIYTVLCLDSLVATKNWQKNLHFPPAISYWPRQCSWEPCPHPSVQVSSSHSYSESERQPSPPEKHQQTHTFPPITLQRPGEIRRESKIQISPSVQQRNPCS